MSAGISKSKSEPVVIGKDKKEKALEGILLKAAKRQLITFKEQQDLVRQFTNLQPEVLDLIRAELGATGGALPQERRQALLSGATDEEVRARAANEEILGLQLENLRQGGVATEEDIGLINRAVEGQIRAGTADIDRFTSESLGILREELAPGRGLRSTDTPILDRGVKLAEEAARQKGALAQGLRARGAELVLDFPLRRAETLAGIGSQQQGIQGAASSFQQQLRNQAAQNRLALTGQIGQQGLGFSTALDLPSARQSTRPTVATESKAQTLDF